MSTPNLKDLLARHKKVVDMHPLLPFHSVLKAGRLSERLRLSLSYSSLKSLWAGKPQPFMHALLSPEISDEKTKSIMDGFKENDQAFLDFLKDKGYLSEDVGLFSSLSGPSISTKAFALAGKSYISMASSLHGHVNGVVFGNDEDTFLVRLQVLAHEVGHIEHYKMEQPFRPTHRLGTTSEQHEKMLANLNRWIYSGLNDNAVHPYKQYSEAFADTYATLILLKECPSSRGLLSRFVQFRERSVNGFDFDSYAACPIALKQALQVDVSSMSSEEIKNQAAVIASDAWLELALSSKSTHEMFRMWLKSDLEAHLFSYKTATSLLFNPDSIEEVRSQVSDHPFGPAFCRLAEEIAQRISQHPLKEKISNQGPEALANRFVNDDQRDFILEEVLRGFVGASARDQTQVNFEQTVHEFLHEEWQGFQQDLHERGQCVEWLKTQHAHEMPALSVHRLRKSPDPSSVRLTPALKG